MATWGAAKAKAQFSSVLDMAESEGPQMLERRKTRFILLTEAEWAGRKGGVESPVPSKTSAHVFGNALRLPPEDPLKELPRLKWPQRKANAERPQHTSGKALWDALRLPPDDGIDTEFPRLGGSPRKVEF